MSMHEIKNSDNNASIDNIDDNDISLLESQILQEFSSISLTMRKVVHLLLYIRVIYLSLSFSSTKFVKI